VCAVGSKSSGVSNQIISLPKGGGAFKGIGEKFFPDLHTGTGNFSVPISLPPIRSGFQSQINLVYNITILKNWIFSFYPALETLFSFSQEGKSHSLLYSPKNHYTEGQNEQRNRKPEPILPIPENG